MAYNLNNVTYDWSNAGDRNPLGREMLEPKRNVSRLRAAVMARRLIVTIGCGQIVLGVWGCGSDELAPYDHAAEVRRDATILLTTRPAADGTVTADVEGR